MTTQLDDKEGMECKLEFFSAIQICSGPSPTQLSSHWMDGADRMGIEERGGSSISGNDDEMGKSVTRKNQQSTVISFSFQNYLVSQDPDH